MTAEEYLERSTALFNQWAIASNESDDQEKIAEAGELFIASFLDAITLAGGTPDPPPPRVR